MLHPQQQEGDKGREAEPHRDEEGAGAEALQGRQDEAREREVGRGELRRRPAQTFIAERLAGLVEAASLELDREAVESLDAASAWRRNRRLRTALAVRSERRCRCPNWSLSGSRTPSKPTGR